MELVREKLNNDHVYEVWFSDLRMESIDTDSSTITIQVPSRYVYEYLEQYCVGLLSWALSQAFGKSMRLQYRLSDKRSETTVSQIVDYLATQGFQKGVIPSISIPNACQRMKDGLKYFLGDYQWIQAYDEVASWLADNKGRGLLCVGPNGLGKTLICTKVIPVLLGHNIMSVTSTEMNRRIDELLNEKFIIIDDLGKEDVCPKVYGTQRHPFYELLDAAERDGKLLIITTNLSTTPMRGYTDSILNRYGSESISRLKTTTHVIEFQGTDLRH